MTYLIEQKLCDPNVGGKQGGTLLHAVSVSGHLNIMKYLIDKCGCDPNSVYNSERTPLFYASVNGYLPIVKYLIEEQDIDPCVKLEFRSTYLL